MTFIVCRVTDAEARRVMTAITPDVQAFYQGAYGTAEEAGAGEAELFTAERGGGLVVAYGTDGVIAGTAGWTDINGLGYSDQQLEAVYRDETAELKRLFVMPQFRGQGLATQLETARLRELFDSTGATRYQYAVGETGHAQTASQHIHTNYPYRPIRPFGAFHTEPRSVFYEVGRSTARTYLSQQGNRA